MKAWAVSLLAYCMSASAVNLEILSYQEGNEKRLPEFAKPLEDNDVFTATGLVRYEPVKRDVRLSTGFFIAPRLFLTARHPRELELLDCASISVHIGNIRPDVRNVLVSTNTFTCKKILQSNARYGFLIFETDKASDHFIPVADFTKEVDDSGNPARYAAVGYSADARLLASRRCEVERGGCTFCTGNKLDVARPAWGEAHCLFRKGMPGSPLVVKQGGRWVAWGMLGTLVRGGDPLAPSARAMYDFVSWVKLAAVVERFGSDLTGRE